MLQKIRDRNIWLVYGAILDLGVAYGISISLIAHHLDARGFSKSDMGSLAVWFALGIVAFSIPSGAIVRRFSAKRTLLVSLVGYSICVSVFPWLTSYEGIAAARVLDGVFSVGIWVSCETILLMRASSGIKALVTSLYAVSLAIGYVLGPLVARVLVLFAPMWVAFGGAGVLTIGAVVIASRLDPDRGAEPSHHHEGSPSGEGEASPGAHTKAKTPVSALVYRIKTSCFATFTYGYFQASVVLFLPLFLEHEKHIDKGNTIIIPAFFALGMLLFSNVAGRLGDRYGHLLLMRMLAIVGLVMILGFEFLDAYPLMAIAVFIAGATLASISPVSLALQGVVTDGPDLSRSNGIYNAFYAGGMLVGPAISGKLFERWGGGVMLDHLAALWAVFVLFCFVFRRDDPAAGRSAAAVAVALSPGAVAPAPVEETASV